MLLDELTALSNYYGSDENLVLAGGGNTSLKDGDFMYIKGSGTALSTITNDGFVKMNRKKLAEVFEKTYPDDDKTREAMSLKDLFLARTEGEEKRPSVETLLHSLFPFKYVLHLHPSLVNGLTCSVGGRKASEEIFGDSVLWIEPCKPGYTLAKICCDALATFKKEHNKPCDMMLLANHGVFVAAETREELDKKLSFILEKIGEKNIYMPDFSTGEFLPDESNDAFEEINAVFSEYLEDCFVTFEPNTEALRFAKSEHSAQDVLRPFTPDHIVYCKPYPLYLERVCDIKPLVSEYLKKHGYLPKILLVKDCGFFSVDKTVKGASTAAALFDDALKIAVYSKSFGGPRFMSEELTDFIVNWEAESYRSSQN